MRTYRIRKDQDVLLKRTAKKDKKGESELVRWMFDLLLDKNKIPKRNV